MDRNLNENFKVSSKVFSTFKPQKKTTNLKVRETILVNSLNFRSLNNNLTAISQILAVKEQENFNFFDPKFLVIAEIRVDHDSKSCLILTSSNDKRNFLIWKLGFLDKKNVKIEQILDSNLVIKRKYRVDTYLNSFLK